MSCAHNHGHGHGQTPYPVENLKVGNKWIKVPLPLPLLIDHANQDMTQGLTQNRLNTFLGGFFADVNLYSKLYALRTD